MRLFVDGIPASAPDGSGQAANFPLGSAERIEVVRGPFASLYGASSGGAILLYTQDGTRPGEVRVGVAAGADGLWRLSTQASGQTGTAEAPGWSYSLDAGTFATDGQRPQSAAHRSTANAIYTVLEGEGSSRVGNQELQWRRGDVFVVPAWQPFSHTVAADTHLIRVSDEPVMRAFDMLRSAQP